MPVRIKVPGKSKSGKRKPGRFDLPPLARQVALYSFLALVTVAIVAGVWVSFVYAKYARLTDAKLQQGLFPNSSLLYAAPETVGVGDPGTPLVFANRLRQSGYGEDAKTNPAGWYRLRPDAIEIFPGERSPTSSEPGVLKFQNEKISSIIALSDNSPRTVYTLEPQLLSSLYNKDREKRRIVHFDEIPPVLIHALISIEDKRFFQHSGFDPMRIMKAVYVDLRSGRKDQGASTLTQQLARMLWLDPSKTFARKFDELLITIHLEHKLTKPKIFEYYANQVPLGRRGSFAIRGFGEASDAYFGKDIRQLSTAEAATLAGLIQEPSYRNPARWPDRARARRDVVLKQMLDNGYLSQSQYQASIDTPMLVAKQGVSSADAPYFIDLVNNQLTSNFADRDFQDSGSKIYTTLDPQLQHDAADAVAAGMQEIQALIAKRRKQGTPLEEPQVALICLDPHTGEVKALIGGKNYGLSQFDHVTAKRPSGSIFKPFVYAAALNTGLWDHPDPITASSIFPDQAQTFMYAGESYEPNDYHKGNWLGDVTLRTAFAKSLNVPAVEVAQQTGYGAVAALAHKAGLADIHATPSMALGAYSVTPYDMAGAYTMFANKGVQVAPQLISKIVDQKGTEVWSAEPKTKKILDPRVTFLTVSLMQEVLRTGTGAGVRSRGFALPAAGKTGTSNDAWFAGFTTRLLCIVWVGLDDYHDIKMDGSKAALPIWADFMKRAHKHRAYRDASQFEIPDGLVTAQVDADGGQLATSTCPRIVTEYYLQGTQPTQFCTLHSGGAQIAGWDAMPTAVTPAYSGAPNAQDSPIAAAQNRPANDRKKRGILDKLKGIFK